MPDKLSQYEGSVAPAFLERMGRGKDRDFLSKLPLRLGRVVRVHNPDDASSRSRAFFEYDVLVEEGSENTETTRTMLPHCWCMSEFGGAADFSRSTPRVLDTDSQNMQDFGTGSRVLVMLINASSFAGVIIGGIQHSSGEHDDRTKGHHSIWQFNGVRREVDSEGQLHYTMKGATDARGNLLASANIVAEGTGYHLLKDGTIQFDAKNDWQETVGNNKNVTVQRQATLTSQTAGIDFIANAGLITTSSLGVHLGAATNAMMLGTTYRAAETALHSAKGAAWGAASAAFIAESTTWGVFAPFAVVLDPTGTLTAFALASASATAAAGSAAAVAAGAITTFEGAAATFLSLKNLLD
jgi:hypothetical protein